MTALEKLPAGDRQVLLLMIVLSLGMHTTAFLLFRVTDKVKIAGLTEASRVQWMRPQSPQRPGEISLSHVLADTLDPSLMSLPSARGFSREMWERGAASAYRAHEWVVRPAFLDAKQPGDFPALLRLPPLLELVQTSVQKIPPAPEEPAAEAPEPPIVLNQTALRVAGALEGRAIVRAPQLPVVTSQSPLRPTRVRVGVAAGGAVMHASVERSCGNESVDARALELARQIRFEPASPTLAPAWGIISFLWATQPPAPASDRQNGAQP